MPTAHSILNEYDARIADIRTTYADRREALLTDIDQTSARLSELRNDLSGLDARIQADVDAARSDVYDALHVKLDPTGAPVPRQGAPRGPRQKPTETPPAETPGADGVALFAAAVSDPGPDEPLTFVLTRLRDPAISDWTNELDTVSETAIRVIDRHRIGAGEAQVIGDDRVKVDGRWWTMADEPRVIA